MQTYSAATSGRWPNYGSGARRAIDHHIWLVYPGVVLLGEGHPALGGVGGVAPAEVAFEHDRGHGGQTPTEVPGRTPSARFARAVRFSRGIQTTMTRSAPSHIRSPARDPCGNPARVPPQARSPLLLPPEIRRVRCGKREFRQLSFRKASAHIGDRLAAGRHAGARKFMIPAGVGLNSLSRLLAS